MTAARHPRYEAQATQSAPEAAAQPEVGPAFDPLFILQEVEKVLGEWGTGDNPVRRLMADAWREHPELNSWLLKKSNERGHNYAQELITARRHQLLRQLNSGMSIGELHKALEGQRNKLTVEQRSLIDEFMLLKPHVPTINTIRKILAQKVA